MKRVLLTGSTGFVGRHCVPHLERRGWEVHTVSRSGEAMHRADLLDAAETSALIDKVKPSALLHLAWYAKHGEYWSSERNLDWLSSSLHLLREFIKAGGTRFVGGGTCAEYSWLGADPCDESVTPCRPASVYGACKYALSVAADAFCGKHDVSFAWGRLFYLFGPGEDSRRLVPNVIRALLASNVAHVTPGDLVRDYMHVDDAASALAAVLDHGVQGVVNIASGSPVTLREISATIGDLIGRSDLIARDQAANPNDPATVTATVARLRDEIGWTPSRTLREGLEETIEWWRADVKAACV